MILISLVLLTAFLIAVFPQLDFIADVTYVSSRLHSVVTERPETRQHRDATRHRSHRQEPHARLRVPGTTPSGSAA